VNQLNILIIITASLFPIGNNATMFGSTQQPGRIFRFLRISVNAVKTRGRESAFNALDEKAAVGATRERQANRNGGHDAPASASGRIKTLVMRRALALA
jgi:hypothetical protein